MNNDKYIPHRRISVEDLNWVMSKEPCVIELWGNCWQADGFGDSFKILQTKLSDKSFRKAKKVLENVLFEFKPIHALSPNGRAVNRLGGSQPTWSQKLLLAQQFGIA